MYIYTTYFCKLSILVETHHQMNLVKTMTLTASVIKKSFTIVVVLFVAFLFCLILLGN
jgi:hypothetical protein